MRTPFLVSAALLLIAASSAPSNARTQDAPPFGRGMILDDASYQEVPLLAPLMRSNFEQLPAATSLKAYTPEPGNQGNTGTCVGWATAYAARTIVHAIQNGLTDRDEITAAAFSPSYVYNQLRNRYGSDPTCTRGAFIPHALEVIQTRGSADLSAFPFDCARGVTIRDHELAEPHKILEYSRLFHQDSNNKVLPVKKALSEGKPVVIGMLIPVSFYNERDDLWEPTDADEVTPYDGHAMTVVGYDDDRHGGAFEIMNSWGTRWGSEGFVWVKYDDFSNYVKYGFDVFAAQELPPDEPPLAGSIELKLTSGAAMVASRRGTVYRMDEVYPSGTEFEAFLTNEQPAYVYAFASDLTRKLRQLVPVDSTISAFLPYTDSRVSLTGDYVFYLDDRPGIDYLTVLYSLEELDLAAIAKKVEQGSGTHQQRVLTALGDRAIDPTHIDFSTEAISFTATGGGGGGTATVLPITVEIEHVGATEDDTHPPVLTLLDPHPTEDEGTIVEVDAPPTLLFSAHDESGIAYVTLNGEPAALSEEGTFTVPIATLPTTTEVAATDAAGNRTARSYTIQRKPQDTAAPAIAISEPRVIKGKLRGIGIKKRKQTRRVIGTVSDESGVAGVYVNGIAARIVGGSFEVDVPLEADQTVLTLRAIDTRGNEETAEYQIVEEGESEESYRASPDFVQGDEAYVTVNVYYGTDRDRTGETGDPGKFYSGRRGQLEYGRAAVSIPKGHSMGQLESPVWWRFEFREDPTRHVMLQEVMPMNRGLALEEMREVIARSAERSAFVFIHGYNVSFEDAARRTGQLAYDLAFEGAPIFYSWPSDGRIEAYTRDEADVEWAWPHLYEFLEDVSQRTGADRVHVIAHSMGNRATANALQRFAREGRGQMFDQVLLAAPDIDAQVFAEQIAPVIPATARRVTLYASSKDRALQASKAVHGHARAGDSGDGLIVAEGIDTIDASTIDTDLLGHGYFAQAEPILRDLYVVLRDGVEPEARGLVPALKDVLRYWLLAIGQ